MNLQQVPDQLIDNAIKALMEIRKVTADIEGAPFEAEQAITHEWMRRYPDTVPPCLHEAMQEMGGPPACYSGPTETVNLSAPEPPPEANDNTPVWELVIADMHERDHEGRRKYGVPLQAENGRNPLVDAYQEALDLSVYLRQAIEEERAQGEMLDEVQAAYEDLRKRRDSMRRYMEAHEYIGEEEDGAVWHIEHSDLQMWAGLRDYPTEPVELKAGEG